MSAGVLISLPFLLFASAPGWVDPSEDVFETATVPALDLVGLDVTLQAQSVVFTLNFDASSTNQADLENLQGYIDLDTDFDSSTGQQGSHFGFFVDDPFPEMGVDYYVFIGPGDDGVVAELWHVVDGVQSFIGSSSPVRTGLSVSVTLPRCQNSPDDGLCIGNAYRLVSILGNGDGPTDGIPNGAFPLTEGVGDFDHDGLIGDTDLDHLRLCRSGQGVPYHSGCADADLDKDGDVDQDDFGILQRNHTGS
jgi:hypothetical protein